jgi:cobaltochelatase CobS
MNIKDYVIENNLPAFIETWEQVTDLTGVKLEDLPIDKKVKSSQSLEQSIAQAIAPFIKAPGLDEKKVIELIKLYAPVKEISITQGEVKTTVAGMQHENFEKVLKMISAGLNLYLYGPAGTGKTQLAENCAIALNKEFYCISVCAQSTKSDLLGFIGATGNYVSTLFRNAYENGGVFLIDEIDNGNPNVLAVLNACLVNGYCAFPDGMIKRHADFICIAAANTFGTGADRSYVGRNQLDAATLNRFVQVEINYDENLELTIFGPVAKKVQAIRAKMKSERVIVSMRNISNMCKLIAAGFSAEESLQLAVINTIPENLRSKI